MTADPRPEVLVIAGTRPEALKVAPLVRELGRPGSPFLVHLVLTGQHPDLADDALADLGVAADGSLRLEASERRSQAALLAALHPKLEQVVTERGAAAVVVQGDTASALAGGMAALWARVPLVHLEAGLRSGDLAHPFPEEAYRRQLAALASLHLTPTPNATANLVAEGIDPARVCCTGNTIVDAVRQIAAAVPHARLAPTSVSRRVLVTVHRRESWGRPLLSILRAIVQLADGLPDVEFVLPVHPNPQVGAAVRRELAGHGRVRLVPPLRYPDLIGVLASSTLVLTDSGGIQEEAPTFGVPVLVLREVTERNEAVVAGCARLVGTDTARIVHEARTLLTDPEARRAMAAVANPFGDGRASQRAVAALSWLVLGGPMPEPWVPGPASPPLAPVAVAR